MPSAPASESQEHKHYQCFMHWQLVCDTTSAFRGKGKKSAWQAWQAYEEVTETFTFHPFQHLHSDSGHFQSIERLTVILYDKTSPLNPLMKQEKSSFAARAEAWTGCHPRRMHSYSMFDEQCTKLEYGQPAPNYSKYSTISAGFCLVQGSINEVMGASLDDHSRSLQSIQGADEMFLQGRLYNCKMQIYKGQSSLLTSL